MADVESPSPSPPPVPEPDHPSPPPASVPHSDPNPSEPPPAEPVRPPPHRFDPSRSVFEDEKYEQAEFIEREMEQMTEQIKSIIQMLNANQGGELDVMDGMTPLDVIVRILNNQLSSLMWIDEKAEEFNSRIQKLANQGSTAEHGSPSRPKFWMS